MFILVKVCHLYLKENYKELWIIDFKFLIAIQADMAGQLICENLRNLRIIQIRPIRRLHRLRRLKKGTIYVV